MISIGFYQTNQYLSAVSIADSAKSIALENLDQAISEYGLSPAEVAQYKQELQGQIDAGAEAYYSLANSLVPSILLDFLLGGVLTAAGIMLWPKKY